MFNNLLPVECSKCLAMHSLLYQRQWLTPQRGQRHTNAPHWAIPIWSYDVQPTDSSFLTFNYTWKPCLMQNLASTLSCYCEARYNGCTMYTMPMGKSTFAKLLLKSSSTVEQSHVLKKQISQTNQFLNTHEVCHFHSDQPSYSYLNGLSSLISKTCELWKFWVR